MAKRSKINPFYVLLVIVGATFTVTASAYGVMAFKAIHGEFGAAGEQGASLLQFMRSYGDLLMIVELALLGVATFLAIGTDKYWNRS